MHCNETAIGVMVGLAWAASLCAAGNVLRESFEAPRESYPHHLGAEFPGTKATFSWAEEGHESRGALRIDYDFTEGGAYCVWVYTLDGLTGKETTLSFCAKVHHAMPVVVRLVDKTGQVHQHNCFVNGPGWERTQLALQGVAAGLHWGGANDGVVHHPLSQIHIGPGQIRREKGTLLIDEVALSSERREVVTVDFAVDAGPATARSSGFLHSVGPTLPAQDMLAPLKPRLFRLNSGGAGLEGTRGAGTYERLKKLGARVQVCISDSCGYGKDLHWPGDNGDWSWWDAVVDRILKVARDKRYSVEWDIWNEPDYEGFWKRDRERFFETWRRAYGRIRAFDPKCVIVGPSIANFNVKWLMAFLKYANANNVLPDIVAWHEMSWQRLDYKFIPAHVAFVRRFMAEQGIDARPIDINEMIGPSLQTSPGAAVWFFAGLEQAKVNGACHACWPDEKEGVNNGGNYSLDGILTHPDRRPRSTWWAYKGYAEVAGPLVGLTPSVSVNGVAGVDADATEVRVILGRHGGIKGELEARFFNLDKLPFLRRDGKVRIVAERIPDSGWQALENPLKTTDVEHSVREDGLTLTLHDFGPSDAYLVRLCAVPE